MKQGLAGSYQVIGFEGGAVSHCGFATPVMRERTRSNDKVPAFLATDGPKRPLLDCELHPHSEDEGSITLLDEPIDVKCSEDQLKSLKAIFVHSILLARIAAELPDQANGFPLEWRYLYRSPADIWVTAAFDPIVGSLLNAWHDEIREQADKFFRHPAPELNLWVARSRELCRMLISAAIGRDRLYKSYVRYGHVLGFVPDGRIDHLRPLIESKFRGLDFEEFKSAVSDYSARIPRRSSRAPTMTQLLAEDLRARSRIPEMIRRIKKKNALMLSLEACVRFAGEQDEGVASPTAVRNLVSRIERFPYVALNENQDIQILAKDAAIYWKSGLVVPRGKIATLNSSEWYQASEELFSAESETRKSRHQAESCSLPPLKRLTPVSSGSLTAA